jgi:arylsulfatase A-like enzyme
MLGAIDRRRALLRYNRYKRYIDAADLADHVIRTLERQDRDRPFFLWSHFFDTHVPYCPGSGAAWYRQADNYLAKLGYPRGLDVTVGLKKRPATEDEWSTWAALYDGAVRYVDDQIGRIVDALDRLGLRDNTLIVVCGDHGEELGEHGDMSHHFRLYEHNVRVPMLFSMPGIEARRVRGFSTLLDLAPTTAALCGVAPDKAWAGRSLVDGDGTGPSVVVMETFHGSPCLYDKRPLYFAVRSDRYKYLWREYRDRTDRFSPDGPELFDLSADPFERTNIYRPDHPAVIAGNRTIARRMAEIPEISRERIVRAFGPDVLAEANP